jgi:hypothetical protein
MVHWLPLVDVPLQLCHVLGLLLAPEHANGHHCMACAADELG